MSVDWSFCENSEQIFCKTIIKSVQDYFKRHSYENQCCSVLIFNSCTPRGRFLIHKVVELVTRDEELKTSSFGKGIDRRVIVYFQKNEQLQSNCFELKRKCLDVEMSSNHRSFERRPDRQVYIPRYRRNLASNESLTNKYPKTQCQKPFDNGKNHKKSSKKTDSKKQSVVEDSPATSQSEPFTQDYTQKPLNKSLDHIEEQLCESNKTPGSAMSSEENVRECDDDTYNDIFIGTLLEELVALVVSSVTNSTMLSEENLVDCGVEGTEVDGYAETLADPNLSRTKLCMDVDDCDKSNEDVKDDWDANWTEDGECQDEEMRKELAALTGITNPTVEHATGIDYLHFDTKDIHLDTGEYGHIVELFDFSPVLKTPDLFNALTAVSIKDYNLTWVDDTHALAVFANQSAAHEAIKSYTPMLQMRQVIDGTRQSKLKARTLKEVLLPYKKRPATTGLVAHNLISGALGMKTNLSADQRRREKILLKEAREHKKQTAKEKKDIWDGPDQ